MKTLALCLFVAVLSACSATKPHRAATPERAPIQALIDDCEPTQDGRVTCPGKTFLVGVEAATRHYEAALWWEASYDEVFALWGLDKESMEALRADRESMKKQRYYWGAGGLATGAAIVLGILAFN